MKIGILTFHFASNYGALLQSYALRTTINKLPGCETEIINYIPSKFVGEHSWIDDKTKKLFEIKREKLQSFLKEENDISDEQVYNLSVVDYDYICVGSDQVWNNTFAFVNGEYLLPFKDIKAKKISYAASVGASLNSEKLDKILFRKCLPDFKALSVREDEHVEYISAISGKPCVSVLDPTLLLDEKDYLPLCEKSKKNEKGYILLFWLLHNDPSDGIRLANRLAKKHGLKVIHSLYRNPGYRVYNDGGCMFYEGVEDFLYYIKNAELIITNSYHGSIFSMIFKKKFYAFVVESMGSRFVTLDKKLCIEDRIVSGKRVDMIDLESYPDYEKIYKNIEIEREKSLKYLKNALDIY